jgi:hypothetical protein
MIFLVLLGCSLFATDASPAAGARPHRVTGSGSSTSQQLARFVFDAAGTLRQAHCRVEYAETRTVIADAECLAVKGKRAAIAGKLREPDGIVTHVLFVVGDNGPGRRDTLETAFATKPFRCAQELHRAGQPITSGNIRVR